MKDDLRAQPNPMFVERRPPYDLRLQLVVDFGDQLERERAQDRRRGDAVRQQIVELGAHLQDALRCVLGEDVGGDRRDEGFPVWRGDGGCVCDFFAGEDVS